MTARDPKPEILRLEELAIQVKAGDIKLPRFQRPFVWKRQDMLKLLDSIYKGYPIGSLLLWHSSQRLKSERSIAGLKVDDENTLYPTNYLLDGQQRLTTLCGALFWLKDSQESIWNIHFDLDNQVFIHPKDEDSVSLFPLNRLIGTSDFIRQCMKFEHHPKKSIFVERAERLLRSIKDYKVAVVKIGDMSLEEVAPIFERINSTGRKLTMVDLMMAATWSDNFDLAQEILKIREKCGEHGFKGIPDSIILRSISAAAGFGINKDDIQRLRTLKPDALRKAAEVCQTAMLRSTAFIRQYTPAYGFGFLPYGLQLTHLTEIFRICPTPNAIQKAEMISWFWITSATKYFGGASTGQNSADLKRIREFASGHSSTLSEDTDIDISEMLYDKFSLRNASSTTIALLLMQARPPHTIYGKELPEELPIERITAAFGKLGPKNIQNLNISRVINPYRSQPNIKIDFDLDQSHNILSRECLEASSAGDSDRFLKIRSRLFSDMITSLTSRNATYRLPLELAASDDADYYDEENIDENQTSDD